MEQPIINTSRYNHSPSASIQKTINQPFVNGSFVKVTFDEFEWNDLSIYDFSLHRFNFPKAGRVQYTLTAGTDRNPPANTTLVLEAFLYDKNANLKKRKKLFQENNRFQDIIFFSGAAVFNVNVGDFLELYALALSDNVSIIGSSNATTASLYYLT